MDGLIALAVELVVIAVVGGVIVYSNRRKRR